MQNKITTGTLAALVFSAALGYAAQQPGVGAPPVAHAKVGTNTDSRVTSTATITGCVQPGAGPMTFVLAESPSPLAPPDAAPAAAPTRDHGTRYELFSESSIDLSKLVGRQVEASGTLSKPAASANPNRSTSRPDALPKFTAKTVRDTGSSC
jgi:hypothetical protein